MYQTRNKLLIIDDEIKILEVVSSYLEAKGFQVFTAENATDGLAVLQRENIALLLLDLMLPDMDGEELCRRIRLSSRIPIIMLTAKNGEEHLLEGLSSGADDYITKPFSLKELYARTEAVLRRSASDLVPLYKKNSFRNGDLSVDFEKGLVLKKQAPVSLTRSEFSILAALIKYPGKIFTREELIELALGNDFQGYDRAIDSHIKNLRQKIEDTPKQPVYICTVHGKGYKFGEE